VERNNIREIRKTIFIRSAGVVCMAVVFSGTLFGKDLNTAQKDSTLRREMLLEGEYTPTIRDADKINILPEVEDLKPTKATIQYSSWSTSTTPPTESARLQAEHFGTGPMLYGKRGYVTLGGGNLLNIRGAAGYEFLNTENDYLRVSGNHFSTNGNVTYLQDDSKKKAKLNDNLFNAFYKHRFDYFNLNVSANYGYTGFNYYGYDFMINPDGTIPDRTQVFQRINPGIGIKSTHDDGINYEVQIDYSYFTEKYGTGEGHNGLSESDVFTRFDLNKRLEQITPGIKAEMHNLFYTAKNSADPISNYTNVAVSPYFEMGGNGENWKLHVGATLNCATEGDKKFTIAPDFSVEYDLSKGTWLYAEAGGRKEVYTKSRIAEENRYLSPGIKVPDAECPLDARLGIKSSELNYWFFNAYVRYKIVNDMHYYFRNADYTTGYDEYYFPGAFEYGLYDKENLFQAGGQITCNYQDRVGISLKLAKNFWDTGLKGGNNETATKPVNIPDFEVNASVDVLLLPQLKMNIGYELQTGRYGLLQTMFSQIRPPFNLQEKMKDIQNVTGGVNYMFNKSFSVYLQMNNLLNQKYEYRYTYPEQSISAMAGFTYLF